MNLDEHANQVTLANTPKNSGSKAFYVFSVPPLRNKLQGKENSKTTTTVDTSPSRILITFPNDPNLFAKELVTHDNDDDSSLSCGIIITDNIQS